MKPRGFNFPHVPMRVGIPSTNQNNWQIGQVLARHMLDKHGIEPHRLLAEKTNPNPTVAAPHCIAHYDIRYFDEACAIIRDLWKGREAQGDLFD